MNAPHDDTASHFKGHSLWLFWVLFAVAALAIYGLPLLWGMQAPAAAGRFLGIDFQDRDFANYWMAARLVLSGEHMMLFPHDTYYALLKGVFGPDYQIHSWSYPPHYLLLVWPLGFLSYAPALAAFLLCTFAMFVASALVFRRRFAPEASLAQTGVAMVAFVAMMIAATQNGFLTATLMLLALAFMRDRPWIAGLALALLTVKPQLGLLFAVVVLIDRNWRVLAWTAAFSAALVLLSVMCFGLESWQAFFHYVIPYQQLVMTNWYGIFLRMMPSVFGSLRTLGLTPSTALTVHLVFAVAALPMLLWLLVRLRDPLARAFVLLAGTFLLTPYSFNYDMGGLSLVAALLAQSATLRESRLAALGVALVAVLPGVMTNLGRAGLPLSPLILALGVVAVAVVFRRTRVAVSTG